MTAKTSSGFNYSEYSKSMRLALSNEDFITPEGDINHEYFLVKKGGFWSEKNENALIRSLEIFGFLIKPLTKAKIKIF